MSLEATLATWKLTKKQVTATEKLFLLSCANRAGEAHECWPSLKRLCADTGMDRKTIINVRQSVIDKGLLIYTGSFSGRSKQIPVMQLTYIDDSVSELTSTKNGTCTSTKNGTGDQYQKRYTESIRGNLKKENNILSIFAKSTTETTFETSEDFLENPVLEVVDMKNDTGYNLVSEPIQQPISEPDDTEPNNKTPANRGVPHFAHTKNQDLFFAPATVKTYKNDSRFMSFYTIYPKKIDPNDAYKAFKSVVGNDDDLLSRILEDVNLRKKKHSQWTNKQFIKAPARYLRSGEYDGEIINQQEIVNHKQQSVSEEVQKRMEAQEIASKKAFEKESLLRSKNNQSPSIKNILNTKGGRSIGLQSLLDAVGLRVETLEPGFI